MTNGHLKELIRATEPIVQLCKDKLDKEGVLYADDPLVIEFMKTFYGEDYSPGPHDHLFGWVKD